MSQINPLPTPTGEATGPAATPKPSSPPQAAPFPTATPELSQRLLIQESEELGVFIYTVIDRSTGQVVTQIPRESLSEIARQSDYSAGQVIITTA
jgi:hypothetical protein